MECWKCGTEMDAPAPGHQLGFRATCDRCMAWLHCCKNCKNYKPGLPNDCMIPGTEQIADREACNFCEEFVLAGKGPSETASPDDVSKKLFGESEGYTPKNFGDLFKE